MKCQGNVTFIFEIISKPSIQTNIY